MYLDKLAGQVFDLEETIGCTIASEKASDPQTITNLQALDFLRQSLEDLALLTLLLGNSKKKTLGLNELRQVGEKLKLKSTRSLLEGENCHHFGEKTASLGDLDLF